MYSQLLGTLRTKFLTSDMTHRLRGETRLIVFNQRDDVPAWDVVMIDNGEHCGVEIEPNVEDVAGRNRREA